MIQMYIERRHPWQGLGSCCYSSAGVNGVTADLVCATASISMTQSILCFILTCFSSFSGVQAHLFQCEDMWVDNGVDTTCAGKLHVLQSQEQESPTRSCLASSLPCVEDSLRGGCQCVHRALAGMLFHIPYFCVPGQVCKEQPRNWCLAPVGNGCCLPALGPWLLGSPAVQPTSSALFQPASCEMGEDEDGRSRQTALRHSVSRASLNGLVSPYGGGQTLLPEMVLNPEPKWDVF